MSILLEYVFLEVVTVLLARRGLPTAARVATILLLGTRLRFLLRHLPGCAGRLGTQSRGALSFTDAAIVTVARSRGASVVTFDEDFRDVNGIAIIPN